MSSQDSLNKLIDYRAKIEDILLDIEAILQIDFHDEYSLARQHWLSQIKTALRDNTPYLPRGDYTMQYTVERIIDKINGSLDKGVSKYI